MAERLISSSGISFSGSLNLTFFLSSDACKTLQFSKCQIKLVISQISSFNGLRSLCLVVHLKPHSDLSSM